MQFYSAPNLENCETMSKKAIAVVVLLCACLVSLWVICRLVETSRDCLLLDDANVSVIVYGICEEGANGAKWYIVDDPNGTEELVAEARSICDSERLSHPLRFGLFPGRILLFMEDHGLAYIVRVHDDSNSAFYSTGPWCGRREAGRLTEIMDNLISKGFADEMTYDEIEMLFGESPSEFRDQVRKFEAYRR